MKNGLGSKQTSDSQTSERKILKALEDGEWRRYRDLKEKSGLSTASLSKHLKRLEKGIVEKKLDLESAEYPHPVYYRLKRSTYTDAFAKMVSGMHRKLIEQSHIGYYIHLQNVFTTTMLLGDLENYFRGDIDQEELNQSLNLIVLNHVAETIQLLKETLESMKKGKKTSETLNLEGEWLLSEYANVSKKYEKHIPILE